MDLIQTYQGYFQEDGRFIPDNPLTKVPPRRRTIINVLEEEITDVKTRSQAQLEAFERFVAANQAIDDEPLDAEFDAIINQRFNITRELNL